MQHGINENIKSINVGDTDLRILQFLSKNQHVIVLIDDKLSGLILIQRGVMQGCVLSPMLFNFYSDVIITQALEKRNKIMRIGGEKFQ